MKRIQPGILIVLILALLVMGYLLYTWIDWFFVPLDVQNVNLGFGPDGSVYVALGTGIPLSLLRLV